MRKVISDWKWRTVLFALLTVLYFLPMLYTKEMKIQVDGAFHLSRIYELAKGFEVGKIIPDLSAYTFNQQGQAVSLFYPSSFIYVYSGLLFLTGNFVKSWYMASAILIFITLLVAYYSANAFFKNQNKAFLFAILWSFSNYNMSNLLYRNAYPSSWTFAFLPLALYGLYELFLGKSSKWWVAATGFSLVLLNHLVSAYILVLFGIGLFLIALYKRRLDKQRLLSITMFSVTSMFLTLSFLMPFLKQMLSVDLLGPSVVNMQWYANNIQTLLGVSLSNKLGNPSQDGLNLGVFLLFIYVVAIIQLFTDHRQLAKQEDFEKRKHLKFLAFLSFGGIILISSLFPWMLLQHTFLAKIQFPDRFIFLSLLFVLLFVIEYIFANPKMIKHFKWIVCLSFLVSFFSATDFTAHELLPQRFTPRDAAVRQELNEHKPSFNKIIRNTVADKKNYDYISKRQVNYQSDEKGEKSQIVGNYEEYDSKVVLVDDKKTTLPFSHEGYVFTVNGIPENAKKVRVPMTWYNGLKAKNENGESLTLTEDEKGYVSVIPENSQQIRVFYTRDVIEKMSIVISAISWVVMIVIFLLYLIALHSPRRTNR